MTTHALGRFPKLCQKCGALTEQPHVVRQLVSRGVTDDSVPTLYCGRCCPECLEGENAS